MIDVIKNVFRVKDKRSANGVIYFERTSELRKYLIETYLIENYYDIDRGWLIGKLSEDWEQVVADIKAITYCATQEIEKAVK